MGGAGPEQIYHRLGSSVEWTNLIPLFATIAFHAIRYFRDIMPE